MNVQADSLLKPGRVTPQGPSWPNHLTFRKPYLLTKAEQSLRPRGLGPSNELPRLRK